MRTPLALLAGVLLVGCASGTRVVYVPVSASTPAPAPAAPPPARVIPAPMPPVGVTIVRVDDARMLVSTNQPAYLAVFEIVPNRGVTLVYPASPRQRQLALAGSNWLNVSWRSARGLMDDDDRGMRGRRQRPPVHHVYVVASERPLRLTDNAFDDRTLAAMLGPRLTQAADPYETMAALSRRFVPPGKDEDWGEDVYTLDIARPVATERVAKIYCPDGSVVYTREEMLDRTACPWRGQGRNVPPSRPDSVVASNGRRAPSPMDPGGVARIFRIPTPAETPATRPANGGDVADNRPGNGNNGNNGNNGSNGNGGRDGNDDAGRDKPKGNNGNHYGWGNGNGNGGKDTPAGSDGKDKGNGGTIATGNANGGNGNGNDGKDKGNNGNHYGQEKGNNGNGGNNGNANGQADVQQQGKSERPPQAQPSDPKPAETRPAEAKPDPKPAAEPAAKDEPKPKQDDKPEAKPENKGMRGMMDRMRAKADSSDKDKKGKPDRE